MVKPLTKALSSSLEDIGKTLEILRAKQLDQHQLIGNKLSEIEQFIDSIKDATIFEQEAFPYEENVIEALSGKLNELNRLVIVATNKGNGNTRFLSEESIRIENEFTNLEDLEVVHTTMLAHATKITHQKNIYTIQLKDITPKQLRDLYGNSFNIPLIHFTFSDQIKFKVNSTIGIVAQDKENECKTFLQCLNKRIQFLSFEKLIRSPECLKVSSEENGYTVTFSTKVPLQKIKASTDIDKVNVNDTEHTIQLGKDIDPKCITLLEEKATCQSETSSKLYKAPLKALNYANPLKWSDKNLKKTKKTISNFVNPSSHGSIRLVKRIPKSSTSHTSALENTSTSSCDTHTLQ